MITRAHTAGILQLILLAVLSLKATALQIDEAHHHFGRVNNAETLEKTWVLYNDSDQPIHIKEISLGCDVCMEYLLETQQLAPEQSATLTVWLDPSTFEGPTLKEVAIQIDRPKRQVYKVVLEAFVTQPYTLEPKALHIPLGKTAGAVTRHLRITPRQKLSGPLNSIRSKHPQVRGEIHAVENGSFEVALTFEPGWPAGISKGDVTIWSDDPNDPPCLVKVIVSQANLVEVIPPQLHLAPNPEAQTRILFVKSDWKTCGELTKVSGQPESPTYRIDRAAQPGNYRVFVDFKGKQSVLTALNLHFSKGTTFSVPVSLKNKLKAAHVQ